ADWGKYGRETRLKMKKRLPDCSGNRLDGVAGILQRSQDDSSGFEFAQDMLQGDVTYAINFDRIQFHPEKGYLIFKYLRCHES
ncbi:hypothetical protein ACFPVS_05765, partial [Neisseria weixii]|uniref:hypothetical protein n=2 Tax=Neisseria weixii TaxID=1853276 RepID=UPI003618E701